MVTNMTKAIQQIMLGTVTKNEKQAAESLKRIKAAGYDGIELNGFMIKPTSFLVRMLTKAAGMPVGKGGDYDWNALVKEAGLAVTSIHEDLGTIKREPETVIREAEKFGIKYVVITGMYRFDYSDKNAVLGLCQDLNASGKILKEAGVELLYHNHNCEFLKVEPGKTAYDLISVYKPKLKWVNIDSLAPNALMKQQLMSLNYELVKPEYTYGESRIDFYMERDGERFLTEVKGCTLADDLHLGIGLFPDAPTERGVKHLHELTKAAKEGYHCSIAFVIQMNGIHRVMPNEAAQPEFKEALVKAAKEGVQIVCYSCHVEADSIKITGVVEDTSRFVEAQRRKSE